VFPLDCRPRNVVLSRCASAGALDPIFGDTAIERTKREVTLTVRLEA